MNLNKCQAIIVNFIFRKHFGYVKIIFLYSIVYYTTLLSKNIDLDCTSNAFLKTFCLLFLV